MLTVPPAGRNPRKVSSARDGLEQARPAATRQNPDFLDARADESWRGETRIILKIRPKNARFSRWKLFPTVS
jgi:hypothetical protein